MSNLNLKGIWIPIEILTDDKLSDKEKMIIDKRFFLGRTQMEVADEIGISQAQVSRIEKGALEHIRRLYK